MRYVTLKNMEKATKMIMEKGYSKKEANDMAIKCFAMVNKHTPSVEFFISKIVNKETLEKETEIYRR